MSSAAAQAAALGAHFTAGNDPAARVADFIEQQEEVVDLSWKVSTGS